MAKKKAEKKESNEIIDDLEINPDPKKEHSELDQKEKDYAQHPKFAKFNSQGSEQP